MRAWFSLILVIGGPFYAWDGLVHGNFGQVGIAALLFLLGLAGLYTAYRNSRIKQGQEDFWLRQRRR